MAFTIMKNALRKIVDFLNNVNIVSIRIWITMGCVVITTLAYVVFAPYFSNGWEPTWEWLLFLLALSGVDISAYAVKRWTHVTSDGEAVGQKIKIAKSAAPRQQNVSNDNNISESDEDEELATTDISELQLEERG